MIRVKYKWNHQTIEDGEVVDNDFYDKLKDMGKVPSGDRVVLVRYDMYDDDIADTMWAEVANGKLPYVFSDAMDRPLYIKVPKRFHQEIKKNRLCVTF